MPTFGRGAHGRDRRLLRELREGRVEAVDELFRAHWDELHRTAFLIVRDSAAAEDIAQESMLAAIRAIDSFDWRRPFRPWIHRIAMNRSLDWLRKQERRRETRLDATAFDPPSEGPTEPAEISDRVLGALDRLDPDQRVAIVMRHALGYTPREIGRMLDEPSGTIRARISRGLAVLRESFQGESGGRNA